MWVDLPDKQKQHYQKLITNFASLSEAFAQKSDDDDIVSPIVNSKFQESSFQFSFDATIEDISNTSFDASINYKDESSHVKYLIGIKTFGVSSSYQKIAQFKSISARSWNDILDEISNNAKKCNSIDEVNSINHELYLKLINKIANARNARIRSSRSNLKGFKIDDVPVESVYHVLMPSRKNTVPKIFVGETNYSTIDTNNIYDITCTSTKHPTNISFTDGIHKYRYTSADSQLLMSFDNDQIILDEWPVKYIEDAFAFFENMNTIVPTEKSEDVNNVVSTNKPEDVSTVSSTVNPSVLETHSWYLNVEKYSGFNAFYGQSKMARANNAREKKIERLENEFPIYATTNQKNEFSKLIKLLLLNSWSTDKSKEEMVKYRKELMSLLSKLNDNTFKEKVAKCIYRPANEIEIRIPNSRQFHLQFPHFFVDCDNLFKDKERVKLISNKEERTFKLKFIPSNDEINAYINQDTGKSIESTGSQGILGKWVLRDIFQLNDYEPLTEEKMEELNINGIRFSKTKDCIEIEFIWIDPENEPKDIWK